MLIVLEPTRPRPAHDPPMGLSKCAVMRVFSSVRGKLFGMWQSRRLQAQDLRVSRFVLMHAYTHTPWTLVLTLKPAAHKKWQQTVLVVRLGRPVCCFTCSTPLTICFSSTSHNVPHTQSTRTSPSFSWQPNAASHVASIVCGSTRHCGCCYCMWIHLEN